MSDVTDAVPLWAYEQPEIHLIRAGHPRWPEQIAFRDALRRDGELASRYEDLKRRLSVRLANDREACTQSKAAFIAGALAQPCPASPE